MNKKKIISYFILGIISFIVLIYQTFPYSLVKENIVLEVQGILNRSKFPLNFSIKTLKPYWLTGLELQGIEVSNKFDSKGALLIDNVTARLSVLSLFIGNITINLEAKQNNGILQSSITLPLFSAISGDVFVKKADANFKDFMLDNIFNQILFAVKSFEKPELALVLPIISKTSLGGKLNGNIEFQDKTFAKVNLNLKNGYLNIANESLNIPKQIFSKAMLDLNWNGKKINISNGTGFSSENIKLETNGAIDTPADPKLPWQLNLMINLVMTGEVEKDFGFIIPQLLNCPSNVILAGVMKINLVGDSSGLSCQ
jgi:hypothetical protein